MFTPSALSEQVPTDSLKTIASTLPSSLADKVISSQVEQVFVWVIKDSENAAKIVSILRDSGFKNIKVDSKGTTITALAGGLINSASSDEPVPAPAAPETTTTPTSSTFGANAAAAENDCKVTGVPVRDCSVFVTNDYCKDKYISCGPPGAGLQCYWTGTMCGTYGCGKCIPS